MLPLETVERSIVGRWDTDNNIRVAIGATHQESAVLNATIVYNVKPDQECRIEIGSDPEATSTSPWLTAGVDIPMVFDTGDKISVIRKESDTDDGYLELTPITVHG